MIVPPPEEPPAWRGVLHTVLDILKIPFYFLDDICDLVLGLFNGQGLQHTINGLRVGKLLGAIFTIVAALLIALFAVLEIQRLKKETNELLRALQISMQYYYIGISALVLPCGILMIIKF